MDNKVALANHSVFTALMFGCREGNMVQQYQPSNLKVSPDTFGDHVKLQLRVT